MWIETFAQFKNEQDENDYNPAKFVFCLEDVKDYNETDTGHTTVTLESYTQRITIAVKYDTFNKEFKQFKCAEPFIKIVE